jgi:hypothetical protein
VIQAPNLNHVDQSGEPASSVYHGPGWGINNDLWLLAADGTWAELIAPTPLNGAALHPQFSDTGDRLFWAEREATGQNLGLATPGGENPWLNWHMVIAPFSRSGSGAGGVTTLGARQTPLRGTGSFFETHQLTGNSIWFSRTQGNRAYVDEGMTATADGTALANLTNNPRAWEEHAAPSPNGWLLTFNSSRDFPFDGQAGQSFPELQMELYALPTQNGTPLPGAVPIRLTQVNTPGQQAVTADYDWGPNGRQIVSYYVLKNSSGAITRQTIEILTLNGDF